MRLHDLNNRQIGEDGQALGIYLVHLGRNAADICCFIMRQGEKLIKDTEI